MCSSTVYVIGKASGQQSASSSFRQVKSLRGFTTTQGASAPTPTLFKGQPCLGKLCEQPRVLRGLMEEATGLWEPRRDT